MYPEEVAPNQRIRIIIATTLLAVVLILMAMSIIKENQQISFDHQFNAELNKSINNLSVEDQFIIGHYLSCLDEKSTFITDDKIKSIQSSVDFSCSNKAVKMASKKLPGYNASITINHWVTSKKFTAKTVDLCGKAAKYISPGSLPNCKTFELDLLVI